MTHAPWEGRTKSLNRQEKSFKAIPGVTLVELERTKITVFAVVVVGEECG